jgi:exopolysaccharide production protein ExoZ
MIRVFQSLLNSIGSPKEGKGSLQMATVNSICINTDLPRLSKAISRPREIVSIQYLRAVAALGVVLAHSSTSLLSRNRALIPMGIGTAGVDIFFVISGFLMYFTTAGQKITAIQFYLRRFVRIVPLYFAVSTVAFLIACVAPHTTRMFSSNVFDYLRSICFIPYFNARAASTDLLKPMIRPEVGQGWTLNYEMFFYSIFGLCLNLPVRSRMACLAGVVLTASLLGVIFRPSGAILQTYTDSLVLEFVLGVLLAYIFMKGPSKLLACAVMLLLVAAIVGSLISPLLISASLPRFITTGIPVAGVVGAALWLDRNDLIPRSTTLLLLGNASYCLYLLHGFVLAILRREWQDHFNVNIISTHVVFLIVGVLISELVGCVAFLCAERPLITILMATLKRRES